MTRCDACGKDISEHVVIDAGYVCPECPACGTDFNVPGVDGYEPERHDWLETDFGRACPTCGTVLTTY